MYLRINNTNDASARFEFVIRRNSHALRRATAIKLERLITQGVVIAQAMGMCYMYMATGQTQFKRHTGVLKYYRYNISIKIDHFRRHFNMLTVLKL